MARKPLFLVLAIACGLAHAEDKPAYTFGTTVVDLSGLQGRVFHIKRNSERLPDLRRMKPVGSVYTNVLGVWPQHFDGGFPGITERFEWFAIEYTGRFWIEKEGTYRFSLLSDDGSRLYINDTLVINNDGIHGSVAVSGGATLTPGVHDIRVEYFQGPRLTVALVLAVAGPGEAWHTFDMRDFRPPKDPAEWQKGSTLSTLDPTM
jgi:hypothetical protein